MPENNMPENNLILRAEWLAFMETVLNDPGIHLIGEGFTSFSESKNPEEYSRKYVHEKSERTDVTGFSPAYAYSVDIYSADPVACEMLDINENEPLGTAARRTIYSVNTWQKGSAADTCKAWKRVYSIVPDGKGDGTQALICSGNMKACGDAIPIEWNLKNNTPVSATPVSAG